MFLVKNLDTDKNKTDLDSKPLLPAIWSAQNSNLGPAILSRHLQFADKSRTHFVGNLALFISILATRVQRSWWVCRATNKTTATAVSFSSKWRGSWHGHIIGNISIWERAIKDLPPPSKISLLFGWVVGCRRCYIKHGAG